jgi:hypothetical protein
MKPHAALFGAIFVAVVVALLVGFLLLSMRRRGRLDPATGDLVMRYSLPYRVAGVLLGLVGLLGCPVVAVLMFLTYDPGDATGYIGPCVALAGMALGGVIVFLETNYTRVVVTAVGIEEYTPWRRVRYIPWDEVATVTSPSATYPFVFSDGGERMIRTTTALTGMELLVAAMRRHLPERVYAPAAEYVRRYAPPDADEARPVSDAAIADALERYGRPNADGVQPAADGNVWKDERDDRVR